MEQIKAFLEKQAEIQARIKKSMSYDFDVFSKATTGWIINLQQQLIDLAEEAQVLSIELGRDKVLTIQVWTEKFDAIANEAGCEFEDCFAITNGNYRHYELVVDGIKLVTVKNEEHKNAQAI